MFRVGTFLLMACLAGCQTDRGSLTQSQSEGVDAPAASRLALSLPRATIEEQVVNSDVISESSGLARSGFRQDLFWTHNDSGGDTAVYAVNHAGSHVATLSLTGTGVTNLDWEDMTSFSRDGRSWLLIGDMGDNNAFRPVITFYLVEESPLDPSLPGPRFLAAPVTAIFQVRLPVPPTDIEALAVDAIEQKAYLVTKRDAAPALFSFSIEQVTPLAVLQPPQLADNHGPISIPRAPTDFSGNPESFNWVTTMDFSEDLSHAYVGTSLHGYRYVRRQGESWPQAFSRPPQSMKLPEYSQIEAGCFERGSNDIVRITSENLPGRMARVQFKGSTAP